MNPTLQAQARELQRRLALRGSLAMWAETALGLKPALHHQLIIKELENIVHGRNDRLIIMMPPGSAKSYYASIAFPPWYLAQGRVKTILACSYSYSLVEGFGRRCRNLVELNSTLLGYSLAKDSKAAGEWETSNGGRYFCAGTNAGIAGHRADLGLIDDPIGSAEEANSKLYRDKLWDWYWQDFMPRLKPGAARVIICNRRHEDDLVGRLLDAKRDPQEPSKWRVIKLQMEARENDVLGRSYGERLWPEWFTPSMLTEAKSNPRTFAGLYQQEPTPESGDFFKRDWILGYQSHELPKNLRYYAASDHAVSTLRGANKSCFIPFGVDDDDHIWILPDIFWKQASPLDCVNAMIDMAERRRPICWRAEKGHISKSLMPLIQKRMQERNVYFTIDQVTPTKDKRARAGSIAGRMQMLKVHFPVFATWWPDALFELMSFTGNGDDKSDDFCDALAHIGMMMDQTTKASMPRSSINEDLTLPPTLNGRWLKRQIALSKPVTMEDR